MDGSPRVSKTSVANGDREEVFRRSLTTYALLSARSHVAAISDVTSRRRPAGVSTPRQGSAAETPT